MMDGILVIRKEKGFTSHDVVAKLRGILHTRKIGHTGTLDPDAEGVLPIAIGKATKLVDMLTEKEKRYHAVLHLGIVTDTQDISGKILSSSEPQCTEEEVRQVVKEFLGEQMQVPPMYSAIKVNGKKLYELAREGKTIERTPRPVVFYSLEILDINLPYVELDVICSKGTYIRTLCHDIGQKLGCGGCMEKLVRTASGSFTLEEAFTLEQIQESAEKGTLRDKILGIEEILAKYPSVRSLQEGDRLLENGNAISIELTDNVVQGWVRMYTSTGHFVGIYSWNTEKKKYLPVKMFL